MADAELMLGERKSVDDNSFADLWIWRVPQPVRASGHQYKYSLAFVVNGQCVLRFDNEPGKGDHFHRGDTEDSYSFVSTEKLLADFWTAVNEWRSK